MLAWTGLITWLVSIQILIFFKMTKKKKTPKKQCRFDCWYTPGTQEPRGSRQTHPLQGEVRLPCGIRPHRTPFIGILHPKGELRGRSPPYLTSDAGLDLLLKVQGFLLFVCLFSNSTFFWCCSFIHMCIHCLGHFSPLLPSPIFSPLLPSLPGRSHSALITDFVEEKT
jgi:hypothetical protein